MIHFPQGVRPWSKPLKTLSLNTSAQFAPPLIGTPKNSRFVKACLTSVEQQLAGVHTDIARIRTDIANFNARFDSVERRLDRIEKRLELTSA